MDDAVEIASDRIIPADAGSTGFRYTVTPFSKRIIPADAGSTQGTRPSVVTWRDHPRGCGEHDKFSIPDRYGMGSSPRMRGALSEEEQYQAMAGIIPADAGSTLKDPCNPNNMIDKISDF